MPQHPKPPGQRRRRNSNQAQWRRLPATGRTGKAPALPRKPKGAWLGSTRDWWKRVWASPMATAWLDSDLDALIRLARLIDEVSQRPEIGTLHTQITALEDRLGLTPKARRGLQWEIGHEEEPEKPRPRNKPRRRAVDPKAAAEAKARPRRTKAK